MEKIEIITRRLNREKIATLTEFSAAIREQKNMASNAVRCNTDLTSLFWLIDNGFANKTDLSNASKISASSFDGWIKGRCNPRQSNLVELLTVMADYAEGLAIEIKHQNPELTEV